MKKKLTKKIEKAIKEIDTILEGLKWYEKEEVIQLILNRFAKEIAPDGKMFELDQETIDFIDIPILWGKIS